MWMRFACCALIVTTMSAPLNAQGLFDSLDPCIGAKKDYWEARKSIMSSLDKGIQAVGTQSAPEEFRDYWWQEKKKLLQDFYNENYGSIVKAAGGDPQRGFEIWLAVEIKKQGGMPALEPIIQAEFQRTKTLILAKQKNETQAQLDQTKKELYKGCPADVGSQVFRGTVTILTAPIGITKENFKAAERESGDAAKLLRAITGVSATDIGTYGVCGGKNSEMRKLFGSLC